MTDELLLRPFRAMSETERVELKVRSPKQSVVEQPQRAAISRVSFSGGGGALLLIYVRR